MIDKNYCMSSYLAFRYIADDGKDFYEGLRHKNVEPLPKEKRTLVRAADDIGREIERQVAALSGKRAGVMLSGGMDSAIVASYLPGADAYTFRFAGGGLFDKEIERAKLYAKRWGLALHYVDIGWDVVQRNLEPLMRAKCAPVHSIEPQIMEAALQAKADGVEVLFIGESSDLIFGGMDKLLSQDWAFDAFVKRYTFTDPRCVLKEPVSMQALFEKYRVEGGKIDLLRFMDEVFSIESSSSYLNAMSVAQMPYYDPYARLAMAEPLDLSRVRAGESKYLIRELFAKRYPDIPVPQKTPMPRPVDEYFKAWAGPRRREFLSGLDIQKFTGNQRWQLYCLERFLDINEPE